MWGFAGAVAHLEERIEYNVVKAAEHRELAESYKQQAFDGMGLPFNTPIALPPIAFNTHPLLRHLTTIFSLCVVF